MIIKDWKKEIVTIPNIITLFRFVLIPFYVTIYLNADENKDYVLAGVILAVSCLTDMIDGRIARKYNMITTLGKLLDPLADKITQLSLILCLASRYRLLWILLGILAAKELFQLVAASMAARKNLALDGALMIGKISTTVLFTSFVIMVIFPNLNQLIVNVLCIVDIVFLFIAFVDYVITFLFRKDLMHPLYKTE